MQKLRKYNYVEFFFLLYCIDTVKVGRRSLGMSKTCLSIMIQKHWPHTHCRVSGVNLVNHFVCEWNWTHSRNCNDWYQGLIWYPLFCHVLFMFECGLQCFGFISSIKHLELFRFIIIVFLFAFSLERSGNTNESIHLSLSDTSLKYIINNLFSLLL